ncbi:hypothetical protein [Bradyrhizobium lablabi]|nr:hypothetical protein [Bradyrhizobium lablabi]
MWKSSKKGLQGSSRNPPIPPSGPKETIQLFRHSRKRSAGSADVLATIFEIALILMANGGTVVEPNR